MELDMKGNQVWHNYLNQDGLSGGGLSAKYGAQPPSNPSFNVTPSQNVDSIDISTMPIVVGNEESSYGGSGIDICNVNTPSDSLIVSAENQWEALKNHVSNIITQADTTIGSTNPAMANNPNSAKNAAKSTPQSSTSLGIIITIGIGVLITSGVLIRKFIINKK